MKFEKNPENPPEQKLEKREEISIGVGDVIINKDGTRRQVVGFDVDGKYYELKTLKPEEKISTPKEIFKRSPEWRQLIEKLERSRVEKLTLEDISLQKVSGLIDRIEHIEQEEK